MLSGVLRQESPAVDARPALALRIALGWTDRALMRPDQVCAASRYGGYRGATLRHPVGARPRRLLTCGNDGRPWRRHHPGGLPPGCGKRPLAVPRHTTPLVGLPSEANLMRRTPPRIGGAEPLPAG